MIGSREENLKYVRKSMCRNPKVGETVFKIMSIMGDSRIIPRQILDAIVQRWERYELDELDGFYFSRIYAGILKGKIGLAQIEMEEEPKNDKMIDENNEILSNLPDPFYAKFIPDAGRGACDDGFLGWNTKVIFETQLHSKEGRINKDILVNKSIVPLEIGYTEAMTTYLHIVQNGGVARYPYNNTKIIIFYNNGISID